MFLFAIFSLVAFGLDRLSKIVIIHQLDLASAHIVKVWPPYLNFVMAWNKGINFGLLSVHNQWVLVILAFAVSLWLTFWVRNKRGWLMPLAVGTIVGGALGNAFDRVFYGAVADYLNMSCCGLSNPFSFNVADALIFCGVAIMIFSTEYHLS